MTKGACRLRRTKDGSYTIQITIKGIRPKPMKAGRIHVLASIDQVLPFAVDFEGVNLKPKLILKLYRKLTEQDIRTLEKLKSPIKSPFIKEEII